MSLERALLAWENIGRGLDNQEWVSDDDLPMHDPNKTYSKISPDETVTAKKKDSCVLYALRTIPFRPGEAHIDPQPKAIEIKPSSGSPFIDNI